MVTKENLTKAILSWGGRVWKMKLHLTREYAVVTKENLTKAILSWGGRVWKIKLHLTREYAVVTKENLTKEILSWGGRVLENKTSSDQGIRRRDQGKSHQGNSRVGG